jgi:hypothetical protein
MPDGRRDAAYRPDAARRRRFAAPDLDVLRPIPSRSTSLLRHSHSAILDRRPSPIERDFPVGEIPRDSLHAVHRNVELGLKKVNRRDGLLRRA